MAHDVEFGLDGGEALRRTELESALGRWQELVEQCRHSLSLAPASRHRALRLLRILRGEAQVLEELGRHQECTEVHRRATALLEPMAASAPADAGLRVALARTRFDAGRSLAAASSPLPAIRELATALRAFDELEGGHGPDRRRCADALDASLQRLASSTDELARSDAAAAGALLREAEAVLDELVTAFPREPRWGQHRLNAELASAAMNLQLGRSAEAHTGLSRAWSIVDRLRAQCAERWEADRIELVYHSSAALMLLEVRDHEGAQRALASARVLLERMLAEQPAHQVLRRDLLVLHCRAGEAHLGAGRLEEAESALRAAENIALELIPQDLDKLLWQQDLALVRGRLAFVRHERGDAPGARDLLISALWIRERLARGDHGSSTELELLADTHAQLAGRFKDLRDTAAANTCWLRCRQILRSLRDRGSGMSARSASLLKELDSWELVEPERRIELETTT